MEGEIQGSILVSKLSKQNFFKRESRKITEIADFQVLCLVTYFNVILSKGNIEASFKKDRQF